MSKRQILFSSAALVLLTLLAPTGGAQVTTATLYGRVTDPTGAVIPGAEVSVINEATSLSKTAVTDDWGEFTVPFLPVGAYTVAIRSDGFKTAERAGVSL